MAEKTEKKCSVVELPLLCEKWQKDKLNAKMECARVIYNQMLGCNLKKYNEMVKTKEWRELNQLIYNELQKGSKGKKKSPELQAAYDRKNGILRSNGFSEFDFSAQSIAFSKYFVKNIPSNMAQLSIGKPMWKAFESVLFGSGESARFKKNGDTVSLVTDNKSGIRLIVEDDKYYVLLSNKMAKAKSVKIAVKGPTTLWEIEMLRGTTVKQIRIVKKIEKGHDNFYVQLLVNKASVSKLDANGEAKHKQGTGDVGISIWRGTLCAVSNDHIFKASLITGDNEFEKQREALGREMEYLRRKANPDNFNEDGTIKSGIIGEDGKRHRLVWNYSNHYIKLRNELRELYRKHSVEKDLLQNRIVLELLSMGDRFYFADTSFRTDKPEWDEEEPLTNAEYKKKKQRRKSIHEGAPATLLSKLDRKLTTRDLPEIMRFTIPEELYWYQHDKGNSDKDYFYGEYINVAGTVLEQTIYRAFLIRRFTGKTFDQKALSPDWEYFVKLLK